MNIIKIEFFSGSLGRVREATNKFLEELSKNQTVLSVDVKFQVLENNSKASTKECVAMVIYEVVNDKREENGRTFS